MITEEEFEQAYMICLKYQLQLNNHAEKVNEKMNNIQPFNRKRFFETMEGESEIEKSKYISTRLKNGIKNYNYVYYKNIVKLKDLIEIDLDDIMGVRGFGLTALKELRQLQIIAEELAQKDDSDNSSSV